MLASSASSQDFTHALCFRVLWEKRAHIKDSHSTKTVVSHLKLKAGQNAGSFGTEFPVQDLENIGLAIDNSDWLILVIGPWTALVV